MTKFESDQNLQYTTNKQFNSVYSTFYYSERVGYPPHLTIYYWSRIVLTIRTSKSLSSFLSKLLTTISVHLHSKSIWNQWNTNRTQSYGFFWWPAVLCGHRNPIFGERTWPHGYCIVKLHPDEHESVEKSWIWNSNVMKPEMVLQKVTKNVSLSWQKR